MLMGKLRVTLGLASCREVSRNHNSKLVSVVVLPLGTQTNHYVEAHAAYIGLQMAVRQGFNHVWLESESINIINCINRR